MRFERSKNDKDISQIGNVIWGLKWWKEFGMKSKWVGVVMWSQMKGESENQTYVWCFRFWFEVLNQKGDHGTKLQWPTSSIHIYSVKSSGQLCIKPHPNIYIYIYIVLLLYYLQELILADYFMVFRKIRTM